MKTATKHYRINSVPGYFTGSEYGIALFREEDCVNNHDELLWYFNDLYKLFLHQYADLGHETEFTPEQESKMLAMLNEMFKVKRMLNGSIEPL